MTFNKSPERARRALRQAQGERDGRRPPFALSLSKGRNQETQ